MIGAEIKAIIIAEIIQSKIDSLKDMDPKDQENLIGSLFDKIVEKLGLEL